MGGKALPCASVRLTRSNYERIAADCIARLRARYPQLRAQVIESYRAKADFGDCDILVEHRPPYDRAQAAAALQAVHTVYNGPVTSVGVLVRPELPAAEGNVFQVDLVAIDPESFDFAAAYFKGNDTGNLVGRIAHAMGTALRHDALVYYMRDGDYRFDEIVLTRDFDEALRFLGYEPQRFRAGFEDLQEVFQFTTSSPFFNRDIFLLQNRNARARVRDRKRPTYTQFLQWLQTQPQLPEFVYPKDKMFWLPRLQQHFAHFRAQYEEALARLMRRRAAHARLNGERVRALTGLHGKQLGQLMQRLHASFASPQQMQDFALTATDQEIDARILAVRDQPATPG